MVERESDLGVDLPTTDELSSWKKVDPSSQAAQSEARPSGRANADVDPASPGHSRLTDLEGFIFEDEPEPKIPDAPMVLSERYWAKYPEETQALAKLIDRHTRPNGGWGVVTELGGPVVTYWAWAVRTDGAIFDTAGVSTRRPKGLLRQKTVHWALEHLLEYLEDPSSGYRRRRKRKPKRPVQWHYR